jgi:ABC-type phosphate transport system auxiliary subunit
MKNMSKTIQVYYIIAISLMMLSIGGGLYYYWTSRLMDTNYTASIHEALSLIDSLKKENTLEYQSRLKEYLKWKEARFLT